MLPPRPVLTPAGEVALPSEQAAQHEVHHGGGLVSAPSQRLRQLLQVTVDVLLQKASGVLHRRLDDVPERLRGPRDTAPRLWGASAPAQPGKESRPQGRGRVSAGAGAVVGAPREHGRREEAEQWG